MSAHGFRPLILQPTRIHTNANGKTSATLIDNIFINDLACSSKEGNITTSISDHFIQFSQLDIFDPPPRNYNKETKSKRNWSIFNKREFSEELPNTNWDELKNPTPTPIKASLFSMTK
jgi:hypothetical protein